MRRTDEDECLKCPHRDKWFVAVLVGFLLAMVTIAVFLGIGDHPMKVAEDICTEQGGGFMYHGNTCVQGGCVFNDTIAWKYPVDGCWGMELWL